MRKLPDPDQFPATVVNVGVQTHAAIQVPLDEYLPKKLVAVEAMEVDIETLCQQAQQQAAEVLNIVSSTENETAEDVQTGKFTWKLEDWSPGWPHDRSTEIEIGRYKWFVSVSMPSGEDANLSLVLAVPGSRKLSLGWSRFASFSFAVVNQYDPKRTVKKDHMHHFNKDSSCCDLPEFLSLESSDGSGGFIVNDSLTLQMELEIMPDVPENYVRPDNFIPENYFDSCSSGSRVSDSYVSDDEAYDSKAVTGFVGLKNQGATCYLNSLIQTLYHLPCFRNAIYEMPLSPDKLPSESTCLALQSLFYTMQFGDTSPETVDLTESLGWDTRRLAQEDAHEFNRVLFAKLDEEMKGTSLDGKIQQLFEGHFNSIVKCINVDHESTRKEPFYDLHLTVKGYKDVYESLDTYVEVEKLDGANQYHPGPEQYSLQDAIKQARFTDFPPILQLHLMRFVYDLDSDPPVTRKINDRYKFPLKLDLDRENGKYLDSREADRSVRNFYLLHSVLVHSGASHNAGHYYAFIRPTLSDQWYKFNDSLVTKEELRTVMEEHCGGEEEEQQHTVDFIPEFTDTPSKLTKHSTAYMLVYVRQSDKERVMCSVGQNLHIPEQRHGRFEDAEKGGGDCF